MSNISETIIKLIDSGRPVLDIAKLFGGLDKLLEITKKYPYPNWLDKKDTKKKYNYIFSVPRKNFCFITIKQKFYKRTSPNYFIFSTMYSPILHTI